MADAFWRKLARRIRRRLYRYVEAEVVRTARSVTEERTEAVAADRDAMRDHLTRLEGTLLDLRQQTANLDRVIGAMSEQLAAEHAELSERSTKLELLLEHPDVLGVSSEADIPAAPTVSIVTPTWNRGWLVGAAIRSVRAQTFSDWELIVVDDGSSDDTAGIVAAFGDVRIRYITQPHSGQCRARNHGLNLAD